MNENERMDNMQPEQAAAQVPAMEAAAKSPLENFLPPRESRGETKKKILILVFLLFCVAAMVVLVVLRAGTPIVDFWTVAGSVDMQDTKITSVLKNEALSGATWVDAQGELALYEKTDGAGVKTQLVVNQASGTVVATLADSEALAHEVQLALSGDAPMFSVKAISVSDGKTRYSLSLYDARGALFAQKKELSEAAYLAFSYDRVLDLVLFDREVFRADKSGSFRRAFTLDAFAELPQFERRVGSFYYIEESDTYYIYDASASLTATYCVPSAAEQFMLFYLSDGTLLAQYVTEEGEHTDDYTYIENGAKFKLHQVLVSARDGETTVLRRIPIYILSVISEDAVLRALGLNTNMENFAIGFPIEDGVLEKNEYHMASVLLSNRGRVTSSVGDIIPAMKGGMIRGIAKNRWIAENLAGECYLLNEWGSVLGRFPSDYQTEAECTKDLFVYEHRIYDWSLEFLYDMKENEVLSHALVGNSVLMRKAQGEVLLYDGNAKQVRTLIGAGEEKEAILYGSLIAVKENVSGAVHYVLYNESAEQLIDIEADTLALVAEYGVSGGIVIELAIGKGTETDYYFAKTKD